MILRLEFLSNIEISFENDISFVSLKKNYFFRFNPFTKIFSLIAEKYRVNIWFKKKNALGESDILAIRTNA